MKWTIKCDWTLQGRLHVVTSKLRCEMLDICRHLELRIQDVVEVGIAKIHSLERTPVGCTVPLRYCGLLSTSFHTELQVCFTMILARLQSPDLMKHNWVIWDPTLTFSETTSLPQSNDVSCLLNWKWQTKPCFWKISHSSLWNFFLSTHLPHGNWFP